MGQLLANILYLASMIFLVGISFSIIFWSARFFHFAHAVIITVSAYVSLLFVQWAGLPIVIASMLAIIACAVLGWLFDRAIYRPMRHRGSSALILLLASLGLYIVLQNVISMIFGDDTKIIKGTTVNPAMTILGMKLTGIQLATIGTAIMVFFVIMFIIDKTRIGLSLRAVSDNPELAKVSGINFDKTLAIAFTFGSSIAGATGIFQSLDVGMTPTMGLPMLLLGVVAVILGGDGKTLGIAIASLFLASLQQIAGWRLGTHWEETAAFLLLLAFLLCRPQGILGKPLRKATA